VDLPRAPPGSGGCEQRACNPAWRLPGHRAELAADNCVSRFESGPNAPAQLALLKNAESCERSDMVDKGGWTTMPGSKDPIAGAGYICVDKLMATTTVAAKQ